MAKAFDASKRAYASGDHARAKQLSDEGHQHQVQMEQLNAEARQWIFAANNADSPPDTVDLHGLYVKEALVKAEEAVQKAQALQCPQLKLIVGKGLHSRDHVTHIKPAVERLVKQYVRPLMQVPSRGACRSAQCRHPHRRLACRQPRRGRRLHARHGTPGNGQRGRGTCRRSRKCVVM